MKQSSKTSKNNQIQRLVPLFQAALFASLFIVSAQFVLPIGQPVPITLQTMVIGIAATFLGPLYGSISISIYLFLGFVLQLPVFSAAA